MTLSINKALPDLSKHEPLDGTIYKHWCQKLLIFFEQLEVDYMLFSNLTEENKASEIFAASLDGADKEKANLSMRLPSKNLRKTTKWLGRIC